MEIFFILINLKKILKNNLYFHLLYLRQNDQEIKIEPTSGKYEYVIILLHGLMVSPITLSKQIFKGAYFPKMSQTKFIFPKGSKNLFRKNDKFFSLDGKNISVDENYIVFIETSKRNLKQYIIDEANIVGYHKVG